MRKSYEGLAAPIFSLSLVVFIVMSVPFLEKWASSPIQKREVITKPKEKPFNRDEYWAREGQRMRLERLREEVREEQKQRAEAIVKEIIRQTGDY